VHSQQLRVIGAPGAQEPFDLLVGQLHQLDTPTGHPAAQVRQQPQLTGR